MLSEATLGDYDIYGELGRGGMAAVYWTRPGAQPQGRDQDHAPRAHLARRHGAAVQAEAQTSAGLSHPHIIQIFTVKETKQLVFFVMKFIEAARSSR